MDIWGRCGTCARWFACPLGGAEDWACPSCGAEPVAVENRAAALRIQLDRPAPVQA